VYENRQKMVPYKAPEVRVVLRPVTEMVNRITEQAVQHPVAAGFTTAITVGVAARGFGIPEPWNVLIGLAAGGFTTWGLTMEREKRLVQTSGSM